MIVEEEPTYSHRVDAVAFHPGNLRDTEVAYDHTIVAEVEGLAHPIHIDVDAQGRIIMFEVLCVQEMFPPEVLAAFKQIDVPPATFQNPE